MRQRVVIAMALAADPELLIADEPTTALDVTIQAQILELMNDLRKRLGTAMILITHDLGIVSGIADDVAVMYCGQIVEQGPAGRIFSSHRHPYTEGLLQAVPRMDMEKEYLETIEGVIPGLYELPSGCRFHPRCPYAADACRQTEPEPVSVGENHWCRCLRCLQSEE